MKRELKSNRGASMVEFALVLPLLLVLVFGIIEFGLLLYNKAMVTNASREGARAGIVFNAGPTGTYSPLNAGDITNIVNSYTANYLVTFTSPKPSPTTATVPANGCVSRGNDLKVTVTFPYTFLVFSNIIKLVGAGGGTPFPGAITLSAETLMRCE